MEVQNDYEVQARLDTDTIIEVSTHVLEAIDFLHKVGYAHGGMNGC